MCESRIFSYRIESNFIFFFKSKSKRIDLLKYNFNFFINNMIITKLNLNMQMIRNYFDVKK